MSVRKDSIDSLKCPICLEYAQAAVELNCCGQIYCTQCIKAFQGKSCPSCRATNLTFHSSAIARRLIAEMEVVCPYGCREMTTKSELERHLEVCAEKKYLCPVESCVFQSKADEFLAHANTKHKRYLLKLLEEEGNRSTGNEAEETLRCPGPDCAFIGPVSRYLVHLSTAHRTALLTNSEQLFVAEPGKIVNRVGVWAQMAQNGKFYCGRKDIVTRRRRQSVDESTMEKGACGPERGSNCAACMALDIRCRKLTFGILVNYNGVVSKPVPCIHGEVQPNRRVRASIRPCNMHGCGHAPVFFCERSFVAHGEDGKRRVEQECKPLTRCYACETLRHQMEKDVYADVWE